MPALDPIPDRLRPALLQQTGTGTMRKADGVDIQVDRLRSDEELVEAVAIPISAYASGQSECSARVQAITGRYLPEDLEEATNIKDAIAATIQERVGIVIDTGIIEEATGQPVRPEELEALHALDNATLKQWLDDNAEDIATCSMSLNQLP